MSDQTPKTIQIKWVRSGIGFSHHQKTIIRSLGLKHLNQVVVRPDTPQTRGIVAAVPHLLAIVPERDAPAWASIPGCTIVVPRVEPAASSQSAEAAIGTEASPQGKSASSPSTGEEASPTATVPQEQPEAQGNSKKSTARRRAETKGRKSEKASKE